MRHGGSDGGWTSGGVHVCLDLQTLQARHTMRMSTKGGVGLKGRWTRAHIAAHNAEISVGCRR